MLNSYYCCYIIVVDVPLNHIFSALFILCSRFMVLLDKQVSIYNFLIGQLKRDT